FIRFSICICFHARPCIVSFTLSLHDALPISYVSITRPSLRVPQLLSKRVFDVIAASALLLLLAPVFALIALAVRLSSPGPAFFRDRKSTRLNSSHLGISYAVFCLKKKKQTHL